MNIINCFLTEYHTNINEVQKIDSKVAKSYFKDKSITNLNQNPKGILLYFPNKSKIVKSYILLKINLGNKDFFVVAMGSKDPLINLIPANRLISVEYLIKIIEIKIHQLHLK